MEEFLTKKFVMSRANVIEKAEGTKINWKEGANPTVKKQKKKRKGKKVTVEVPQKSFFTFFERLQMPSDDQLKEGKLTVARTDLEKIEDKVEEGQHVKEGEEPDTVPNYEEDDIGERLDRDYQLGLDFKDELVPMAYEYYLNVIEHEDSDVESDDKDSKSGGEGDDGEDGDGKVDKKKLKKEKEECK